jgi:CMP-N,N'-diacetyllegionaminic acid synthase
MVGGQTLLKRTIDVATACGLFDQIVLSSDSERILDAGRDAGINELIKRPAQLASDNAGKVAAIRHAVVETERKLKCSYVTVVDLDCSSLFRSIDDIRGAVALLEDSDAPNVVTGVRARKSPYFNMLQDDGKGGAKLIIRPQQNLLRRQDCPQCYDMNASIYVWKREALELQDTVFFEGTKIFVMPEERSFEIDSELDLTMARLWAEKRGELA